MTQHMPLESISEDMACHIIKHFLQHGIPLLSSFVTYSFIAAIMINIQVDPHGYHSMEAELCKITPDAVHFQYE